MDVAQELVVVGLGDPVMDFLFEVGHDVLATIADRAGGCTNIEHEELLRLTAVGSQHCQPTRSVEAAAAAATPVVGVSSTALLPIALVYIALLLFLLDDVVHWRKHARMQLSEVALAGKGASNVTGPVISACNAASCTDKATDSPLYP